MRKELITEINRVKELMGVSLLNESIEYEDISSLSKLSNGAINDPKYFILHHTAGRGSAKGVVNTLNTRTDEDGNKMILGVQWIIDREGKIFRALPIGAKGKHIKNANMSGVPKDINNSTAEGVEIIGNDNSDILEIQCLSALKLVKDLGYSTEQIYCHGEVNSHKMRDEGQFCKSFIKNHWVDNIEELEKEISDGESSPPKEDDKTTTTTDDDKTKTQGKHTWLDVKNEFDELKARLKNIKYLNIDLDKVKQKLKKKFPNTDFEKIKEKIKMKFPDIDINILDKIEKPDIDLSNAKEKVKDVVNKLKDFVDSEDKDIPVSTK
jgi:hypothetical protein